jgi:phenylacetate-CoA ligase
MPVSPFKPDLDKVLRSTLTHTATHSPYYRDQAWARSARRGATVSLKNIPITPKHALREETERFFLPDVPPSEGPVADQLTSGSTGHPMTVKVTARFNRINETEAGRLIQGWDIEKHTNAVRISNPLEGGRPRGTVEEKLINGITLHVLHSGDVIEVFNFVVKTGATRLTTRPQMVLGILQHGADIGAALPLKLVTTITEVVPEQLRNLVKALPDCRLCDKYGTVETGLIAHQCAQCGAYHPADRQSVVEIVDDDGRPTKPGKIGRVIVTTLFNLAMPLVRYETGDHALVSKGQSCPRSPVSLDRIVGRDRNLFRTASGHKMMPWVDPDIAMNFGLRQYKLIQRRPSEIEFHYIPNDMAANLPKDDDARQIIDKCMAPGFNVVPVKVSELLPAANGKYMMHECLI